MGFWIQYRALLYKNWVLWRRSMIASIIELLLPVALVVIIGLIKRANTATSYNAQSFNDQVVSSVTVSPSMTTGQDLPFSGCFQGSRESFYYSIISTDSSFINYMINGISRTTQGRIGKSKYIRFATIDDFNNYITADDYEQKNKICFGVYLKEISSNNFQVDLRFNTTKMLSDNSRRSRGSLLDIFNLDSNPAYNDLIKSPTNFLSTFNQYGFLSLMNLADNYFLTNKSPNGSIEASFYQMRLDKYSQDNFLTLLGNILGFFFIIAFLIPVCRLLAAIVEEKETRTKEMMMMMGLKPAAYWMSWVSFYLLINTIISVLMTIIAVGMKVFSYSNPGLIFLYFWLFSISCIAFSIFLSVFFSKTRNAILVGIPLFIGSYFIGFAVNDGMVEMNKKGAASLLPCVAFSLGTKIISSLESSQTGILASNSGVIVENYSHGLYFGMIIIDIVYLSLFSAYLEAVWPTEWGVKRKWNFLFTSSFWCPKKSKINQEAHKQNITWPDSVEPVDPMLESQKSLNKAMVVRGLRKEFQSKLAVDELNLDIYEGQIFALLGHNGAGKTTTISMLTGLIPPTSGEMTTRGHALSQNLSKIREIIGVCPQQNLLFPNLTSFEHMSLYCQFKGIKDKKKIQELSYQKLAELELYHKRDVLAQNLSGGQKRKLQLGIALIGDSPIVILDEPTSGMDLTARRHVWDTLKNNKNGRIIILTTHYMEEADVLADRIAIMSQGKLRCCGSSLFLKSRYGVGYYLTLVRNQESLKNTQILKEFVLSHISEANLMNDFQGEVTFQLPSSSAPLFQDFFDSLDSQLETFGILSYSMSATTLEEVFLRVARGDDELAENKVLESKDENSRFFDAKGFKLENDKLKGTLFFKHFKALVKKRALSTLRDKKTLVFEIFIPVLLIIIGLALMMIPPILVNYDGLLLSFSQYSEQQRIFYGGNPDSYNFAQRISSTVADKSGTTDLQSFSDYLFANQDLKGKLTASYFFNQSLVDQNQFSFVVFTNQKAYQSNPTAYSQLTRMMLKSVYPSGFDLKYYNHPLPLTKSMEGVSNTGDGFLGTTIFSLGFSFIPTGIVMFIAKEREMNVKHQHMISGVSLTAYWVSNFCWDLVKHILPAIVSSLVILAFNVSIYTSDSNDYGAMWVLIILGGISQAPFSYMLSFFFKSHSSAQIVTLIVSFLSGSIAPSLIYLMFTFSATRSAGKALSWILKLFPNFCFGYGVLSIGLKRNISSLLELKTPYDSFDIESAGGCMLLMGLTSIVYFLLVILFELFETNPAFSACIFGKKTPVDDQHQPDEDVEREALTAVESNPSDVQVNVKNIYKSFKTRAGILTAVNGISLNVRKEECFALLGINGAGKTTFFKLLTGENYADKGQAFIGGYNISKELTKARNIIGYCPQFDAISELLTGYEQLELYANIKGIPSDRVKEQVNYIIDCMDLQLYRDVLSGTYSGGNKRKLSAAMALIGNPSVVFLDEPSAGMDPEARKKMWKILGRIKKQKSAVILTTHSMEEAEALCDRLTIMVKGRLKCIGTSTWVKSKFGDGYELEIKVDPPGAQYIAEVARGLSAGGGEETSITSAGVEQALRNVNFLYLQQFIKETGPGAGIFNVLKNDGYVTAGSLASWCLIENLGKHIENWLASEFNEVEVIEHYHLMFKYKLKKTFVKSIGYLFSVVEKRKVDMKISDYSICMTSLEQIFNSFAKEAESQEERFHNRL